MCFAGMGYNNLVRVSVLFYLSESRLELVHGTQGLVVHSSLHPEQSMH